MTKEWANKDKYHPSNGVLEPCVQMLRAKASEDSSGLGRAKAGWRRCRLRYTGQTGEGHRSDRCRPG
jgi:hypothetical protein